MALPVLHHAWRSSASRRVRLCLAEKGVEFESVLVDLTRGEHHTPQYLKMNPLGVIPLLVLDDGRSLYESGTICEYLDETIADPPLRPEGAFDRATMRNWIRHVDGLIGNLIVFNWKHSIAKVAAQWSDAELAEKLRSIPSKERQEAWLRAARKPYTEAEQDEARGRLVALLDRMEAMLAANGGWLVGGRYSIADIAVVPFVKRIDEEIAPHEMSEAKHPRVHDWWQRIQARPAFTTARIGSFYD
ncbi:MAG: glutathione S-transferase family protein [Alphaproteobacteria bacterium]|nr:glutathione S-transferase family protein [Alphaproteobacteria bacterium]MCW5744127.1 glutathione S-transferase family protein [Alphaproteobacteria bacterium]